MKSYSDLSLTNISLINIFKFKFIIIHYIKANKHINNYSHGDSGRTSERER